MVEDLIIIGSGPAGLTAALYTAREDFKPLVITESTQEGSFFSLQRLRTFQLFPMEYMGLSWST
jgi:Thioredoxin reductase